MAPMPIRLVAAAKGLAVGVLSVGISIVGWFAYLDWRSGGCPAQYPDCNAGLEALGFWFEGALVSFALLLALGPLLAWAFRLPRPALYLIAPFLAGFVEVLVLRAARAGLPREFLLAAPLVVYPVVAALSAGRRGKAPAPTPTSDSPTSA